MRPSSYRAGRTMPASALLATLCAWLLVFAVSGARAVDRKSDQPAQWATQPQQGGPPPRPRIFVYDMPAGLTLQEASEPGSHPGTLLMERLLRSPFVEADPAKADYYWIPGSGRPKNRQKLLEVLSHIKNNHPWWNMTMEKGQARHIMVMTRDSDPGESFGWPITNVTFPADINPVSPTRNILFLGFNGMQDGPDMGKTDCVVCYQAGKDILIPKFKGVCDGPLCGVNLETLRAKSIWVHPPEDLSTMVARRRKRLMFFGGNTLDHHDFTGRGGAAMFYGNHKRYLIQVSNNKGRQLSFPDAMLNSEFCLSPLGGNGGPTDRYVPGIMFGCVPVMLNSTHAFRYRTPHALPLEEVLPWHKFATVIDNWDMANLDKQLQCLVPKLPEMRAALREVWPSLVYTSLREEPFLGETGDRDAFVTIMRVLESRIAHGYAPSAETRARFRHPGTLFPCRPDSPADDDLLEGSGVSPFL